METTDIPESLLNCGRAIFLRPHSGIGKKTKNSDFEEK
jgi:hypothetical protein